MSQVSAKRKVAPTRLPALIRGDLDWIVMKCLEKERQRRYETATSLATDVKRHLNDEPVLARPPSVAYRIGKMARRNRAAFLTTTALLLGLLGGLSIAIWGPLQARSAQELAERQKDAAQFNAAENRRLLYRADMAAAQSALRDNNIDDVLTSLRRHIPKKGGRDLRRLDWYYLWNQRSEAINTPYLRLARAGISGAFSPDGARFAVAEAGDTVEVFDVKFNKRITKKDFPSSADEGWIHSVRYSPDGRYLAVPRADGAIVLYRRNTDEQELLLKHTAKVNSLAFSADGRWLGSGGTDKKVILWELRSNTPKQIPHRHYARVYAVAISPDGRLIASADKDGELIVSDLAEPTDPRVLTTVALHGTYGGKIAFSPDGKLLVCATEVHKIAKVMVIDLQSPPGASGVSFFGRHDDEIRSLAFVPAGGATILATGSRDNSLKLWQFQSGKELGTLRGHSGCIQDLCVSPDGKTLAADFVGRRRADHRLGPRPSREAFCIHHGKEKNPET